MSVVETPSRASVSGCGYPGCKSCGNVYAHKEACEVDKALPEVFKKVDEALDRLQTRTLHDVKQAREEAYAEGFRHGKEAAEDQASQVADLARNKVRDAQLKQAREEGWREGIKAAYEKVEEVRMECANSVYRPATFGNFLDGLACGEKHIRALLTKP